MFPQKVRRLCTPLLQQKYEAFPLIFRARENIPATCARNPLILRALAGIIPRQVHTEWYRSGYNGPDSKSGVPATVPWVRIPPTPPNNIHPHPGMDVVFCCGWDSKAGALATCRWHVATGVGGMRSLCPGGAKPAHAACSREPRKPGIRCHFDGQKACIHASFRRFRNYSHSLPSSLF